MQGNEEAYQLDFVGFSKLVMSYLYTKVASGIFIRRLITWSAQSPTYATDLYLNRVLAWPGHW